MAFIDGLRFTAASALLGAALCGCQGDDNALPLPPDAGSTSDARSDATASHDGAAEASSDAGSAADGSGDGVAQSDSGDAALAIEAGVDTGVDAVGSSDAGDAATE